MSQTPEHPTPTLRPPRTGFPIIPVMGIVGGMVWAACLTESILRSLTTEAWWRWPSGWS